MGLDCSYQGIPNNTDIIGTAYDDPDFAEHVFYAVAAFAHNLGDAHYFKDNEFAVVRALYKEYPDIKSWNYRPSSRMHRALIYALDPLSYDDARNYEALEQTLPYRFVMGEKIFSRHLNSTQGIPVRISSPDFIQECLTYGASVNLKVLADNFETLKVAEKNIYKTTEFSDFKSVEGYFLQLSDFYKKMASLAPVSVFVVED